MSNKQVYTFEGKEVDVVWDGRLCIHIAECGQSKGDLFIGGREPWCSPDVSSVDDVIDVTKRCSSGALTYQVKDGSKKEQALPENNMMVASNGPYYLSGDLEIDGAADDMPGVKFRAALCRCGASKNKPFCDNNHNKIHFEDYGSVGDKGDGFETAGGKIKVSFMPDGPLVAEGNLTIIAGTGRVAWRGTKAFLCRCGESKNKPFCDGSHKAVGFKG